MAKYLKGKEFEKFKSAVNALAVDWAVAAHLINEWSELAMPINYPGLAKFADVAQAWKLVGEDVSQMIEAATGEDLREKFGCVPTHPCKII